MNDPKPPQIQEAIDVEKLARAIRFALAAIVLGLSYFSIRASLSIEGFHNLFTEIGVRLPILSAFVIGARYAFVGVSLLVPLGVISSLFLCNITRSFYVIGALTLVTLIEFILLYQGLSAPLFQINNVMQQSS